MKGIITLGLMMSMFSGSVLADDEKYLDKIDTKSSSIQKKTVNEMEENPRNPAMVESFGQVGSKEDDQDRMEERQIQKTEGIEKGRDYARP